MKSSTLLLVAATLLLGLYPLSWAQEAKKNDAAAYAFSTRVYRLPSPELEIGFVSKERGKLKAPTLPPVNASNGEIEIFLKRSHDVIKDYLIQQGVTLPVGSLACYDPASSTLALRAMAVVHDLVQPVVDAHLDRTPKHLAWTLEMIEAPEAAARAAIQEAAPIADHAAVLEGLRGKGKSIFTMRGETKSGQQISARQGNQTTDSLEYAADDKPRVEFALETQKVGTEFEMDPTVGADGRTIDVSFALNFHHNTGFARWEPLTDGSAEKVEVKWTDRPLARVATSFSMMDSDTRLVGVWALDGETDPERLGLVRAAFFQANLVALLPLEDSRVEQLLKTRGEAVSPTPKAVRPVADPNLPPGMTVRRFQIPPDFLSLGGAPADSAADPFASGAAVGEPQFTRRMNVEEILRSQGIPFPPGSSANFLSATSELVVRNTPENIDLVGKYVESIVDMIPKLVVLSLHIAQADAGLIRKLERETRRLPDHVSAWRSIEEAVAQGSAKVLRSALITTKSGQQSAYESIIQFVTNTGVSYSNSNSSADTAESKKEAGAPSAVAKASVVSQSGNSWLTTSGEIQKVGFDFEIDSTVGVDSKTIDLNLASTYDFAPPTQRVSTEPVPEGTRRIAAPTVEFHESEVKLSTTLLSGSTRMISVWKPSGTPELDGDVLQALFIRADIVPIERPAP